MIVDLDSEENVHQSYRGFYGVGNNVILFAVSIGEKRGNVVQYATHVTYLADLQLHRSGIDRPEWNH